MNDWQTIENAPTDGSRVWVRRVHNRRVIAEGWAVFAVSLPQAPQRESLGLDPLGRVSAAELEREDRERLVHADQPKWLTADRMFSFPTPTHWSPMKSAAVTDGIRDLLDEFGDAAVRLENDLNTVGPSRISDRLVVIAVELQSAYLLGRAHVLLGQAWPPDRGG